MSEREGGSVQTSSLGRGGESAWVRRFGTNWGYTWLQIELGFWEVYYGRVSGCGRWGKYHREYPSCIWKKEK